MGLKEVHRYWNMLLCAAELCVGKQSLEEVQLSRWLEEHLGVTWGDRREPGVPRSNSVLMLSLSLLGLDFVFFLCRHFLIFKEAPNSCVYLANTRLRTEQNMGVLY